MSTRIAYRPPALTCSPASPINRTRSAYQLSSDRVATGVPALDKMLGDGYWAGSSTLVCGPSGVGKTLMGLHFIFQGARTGESGIMATFQETENQLARIVGGFGWSLDEPGVNVLSRSLVDMYIDQWVYELLDLIESTGAKRIVVDSLLDLMTLAGDAVRFREWMYFAHPALRPPRHQLDDDCEVPELFQLRKISGARTVPSVRQRDPSSVRARRVATGSRRHSPQDQGFQT